MHVAAAVAMTLDGKLTRHNETKITDWVSPEDQVHFRSLIAGHDVIIMGRGSYEVIQDTLNLDAPIRRIVLTSSPEQFANRAHSGKLEFTNETPTELLTRLTMDGIEKVLIVGGSRMLAELLHNKLLSEIYLTLEPRIFGTGKPLVESLPLDVQLHLIKQEKLNQRGTLLLIYEVCQ